MIIKSNYKFSYLINDLYNKIDADYVLDAINQLYPSPTTLPLDEICFYRFKKNEIEKEFIEKVLIRSNVPYEEIFRIYHQKTMVFFYFTLDYY